MTPFDDLLIEALDLLALAIAALALSILALVALELKRADKQARIPW
jgi:hypothetical protein